MARTLKNIENETQKLYDLEYGNTKKHGKWEITLHDLEYGEKHWKTWKMRNAHWRTWNMAKDTEKTWKMRNAHCRTWNMTRSNEKLGKWDIHSCRTCTMVRNTEKKQGKRQMKMVGLGIYPENWNTWKMRNLWCRTWNMSRNREKHGKWGITLYYLKYVKKTEKKWKMRNAHL